MKKTISLVLALALGLAAKVAKEAFTFATPTNLGPTVNSSAKGQTYEDVLAFVMGQIGVTRGICVVLGDENGELALDLAKSVEGLTIYVQLPTMEEVEAASKLADREGLYGTRIFVEKGDLYTIHLPENVADVVIGVGAGMDVPEEELLRVLRPQGKAILGDTILTKPFPNGVDDWSHPYHGPDNNPQSNDHLVRAPYLTQFLAEPRYAPLPQVVVASAGRVFKAFGHVAFKRREEPFLNKLVAFNGYNGTMLWQRDLAEGVMIHRNTMIATPETLYIGDDKSCKLLDTATGELKDEIIPPTDVAGGTFWKWMGLEDGVLYALIGEQEQRDATMRWGREIHGWPWGAISTGFNQSENPWGFGRNVLAIDPVTKKVLWSHREEQPVDGRAICMRNGRIYIFRFGDYLACLDAQDGQVVWRSTARTRIRTGADSTLFESLGAYLNRQGYQTNWRTTCYLKCSDKALYFAGPQIGKLLAVSAEDGSILWEHPYSNFQLVLQDDGLYGISGPWGNNVSKKFDPLTGEVLAELPTGRRACTRPTGTSDSILFRAAGGSVRLDLATHRPCWISPMRPSCHDGVTIANGLLYWWPSVCDCQLTLYGVTCLGPAGDFDFAAPASQTDCLETEQSDPTDIEPLSESSADWPTFRANNQCTATTEALVPDEVTLLWRYDIGTERAAGAPPFTAPVAAGELVFVSGPDGIIHAIEAQTGTLRWKAYTAGAVRIAPTIWNGRALVGSGDGWVYCFEAKTGRRLWRFRAAPAERKIPVYGALLSTWPAASGVLVEDGIAYVAAGIVNYDGTYVYALDAATGEIKWQNVTAGHLDPDAQTGVSVQGHLLLHDGKLHLAGGTSISPAIFDIGDGTCLNNPGPLADCTSRSPRGWELSLIENQVEVCGRPFYAHPEYEVYDPSVFERVFRASSGDYDFVWTSVGGQRVMCFTQIDKQNPLWTHSCPNSKAWAVCPNAVMVATSPMVFALSPTTGHVLWSHPLPTSPVTWGMAVDCEGRVVVTLEDGQVLCLVRVPQADINEDGEVNLEDLAVTASQWRQVPKVPSADIGPASAVDGVVDFHDVAVLAEYWLTHPGAVAHWKLDEVEGDIAQDSVGENQGTLSGNPIWQPVNGKIDGALEFDGVDDYVSTPFILDPPVGGFSVFAWIRGGAPGQVVMSQIGAANWLMAEPTVGALMTELKGSGRFGQPLISQTVITDDNWHRVGLTWDGSNRVLYVDDVEVAKDTQSSLAGSEGGLYIGAGKNREAGSLFSGLIDDVRIYNRAVTP